MPRRAGSALGRATPTLTGAVVAEHPKAAVTDAGEWRELVLRFTAGERTVRVRFILDTQIAGAYDEGHVTYDEAALAAAE